MRINNIHALTMSVNFSMQTHSNSVSTSIERLSSGLRINRAADDASSMTIANQLNAKANQAAQEIKNKNDEIGICQIADGAMDEQTNILDSVRVKLIQRANDTQSTESKDAIDKEINRLLKSFSNISNTTQYNGTKLLSGDFESRNGLKIESVSMSDIQSSEITSDMIANYVGNSGVYNTEDLMNIEAARSKYNISGSNYGVVVIDTGVDINHTFFDSRVVYTEDFTGEGLQTDDANGHGTHVSSILGSSDSTYTGAAPGVDIIGLKALKNDGTGNSTYTESALQWVIDNAGTYNITTINMSLGNDTNENSPQDALSVYGDELETLANMGIITVAAAGNDYADNDPDQGASYPGNSEYTIGVGSVFLNDDYASVGTSTNVAPDVITDCTQRSTEVVDIFAAGSVIEAADTDNHTGVVGKSGTSMATPQVAGIVTLIQEYSERELGRTLTLEEMRDLIVNTGVTINDGDDEVDSVNNTGEDYKRIDALSAIDALYEMSNSTYAFMNTVDNALTQLGRNRANVGSTQNMLKSEIAYKSIEHISLKSAASQLEDTDFAYESQELQQSMILSQASSYAFSQVIKRYEAIVKLLV